MVFASKLDFVDAKDVLSVSFEVTQDGRTVQKGDIPAFSLPPRQEKAIRLALEPPQTGDCFLNITYRARAGHPLIPEGTCLGCDQIVPRREERTLPPMIPGTVEVRRDHRYIAVTGPNFRYRFDIRLGAFDHLVYGNRPLITAPMTLNIWRAPTDNDRGIVAGWRRAGYDRAIQRAYEAEGEAQNGLGVITCRQCLAPVYLQPILRVEVRYTVGADGTIHCFFQCEKDKAMPPLPRFGLRLHLPKEAQNARYFGFGPYESYVDKRRASFLRLFETTADENHEDYLRPQENGSHFGCAWAEVTQGDGFGIRLASDRDFSFQLSPYPQEELTEKAHNYELQKAHGPVLCADFKQNGIGSNSCGPMLLEKYAFQETEFSFGLRLIPLA